MQNARYCFGFVLLLTLSSACKKGDPNSKDQYEFSVTEQGSNTAVSGATVDAYKCNQKDYLNNCLSVGQNVASGTTDANGKVFFSKSLDIGSINAKKDKYWSVENINALMASAQLIPIATLKVHAVKANAYAPSNKLFIKTQTGACYDCTWEYKPYGLPADTVIYLKGAGNNQNQVSWQVGSSVNFSNSKYTSLVTVSRFDTALFTVQY